MDKTSLILALEALIAIEPDVDSEVVQNIPDWMVKIQEDLNILNEAISNNINAQFSQIEERLNQLSTPIPYFNQAAQLVLFEKSNTNTFPRTKTSLQTNDNRLISENAYEGLLEGQKAVILAQAVATELGFTLN